MRLPRLLCRTACALFVASSVNILPSLAAETKEEVLIDFTDSHRDPESAGGAVFHAYQYAFETWNRHVIDLPRRGVLVKAPSGKGGLGENDTSAEFKGMKALSFYFVIGNANAAEKISFTLEDNDGTVCNWTVKLAGQPPGRLIRLRMDPAKPDNTEKPGRKPGLDLKKVENWQVRGDWTEPNVEVLLVKVTGEK